MPLDQRVLAREIGGREYADEANGVINHMLREAAERLDARSFMRFFNVRPGAEVVAVRPDICVEVYDGAANV